MENTVNETVNETVSEKKKTSKGTWIGRGIIAALLLIFILLYFMNPSVHNGINNIVECFKSGDFDRMYEFIDKYGKWAMLVSGLLMIFQSIAAPLPAFFITLTNANLFGWWQGCILSWVSSMMGAALCFYIARILGRDVVERICTKGALLSIEEFFAKYGKRCILIARLLPFISFDIVSYAAGLTAMDFWGFFIATGIGQLPACIVYSYVGGMLTGGARKMFIGLMCLFALAIGVVIARQAFASAEKKRQDAAEASGEVYVKEPSNPANTFSKLYCSLLWGMVISCFISTKAPNLAFGYNQGWVFAGLVVVIYIVVWAIHKFKCNVKFTGINLVVSLLLIYIACTDGILRLPAGLIRMAIGVRTISLSTINVIMLVWLIAGFGISVLLWKRQGKKIEAWEAEVAAKKIEADGNKIEDTMGEDA